MALQEYIPRTDLKLFFATLYGEIPEGMALLVRQVADPSRDAGADKRVLLTRFYESLDHLPDEWREDAHVWFGAGLRPVDAGSGGKPVLWPFLWADLDREELGDLSSVPPPTAVVRTGRGFQVYWKLRNPVTEPVTVYKYLRGICIAVGADQAAAEPSRLLRVPGTWNVKYNPPLPCELLELHPDRVYDLAEFPLGGGVSEGPPPPQDDIEPEPVTWDQVAQHLSPLQRRLLREGTDEEVQKYYKSWSEFEFGVVITLLRKDFTKEQVYGFFVANQDLVIWHRGKRGGDYESILEYLRRTIHKAAEYLKQRSELAGLAEECGLVVKDSKIYAQRGKDDVRLITNFEIIPIDAVEGDDEGVRVECVREDGYRRVILLSGEALSSRASFRRHLGDQFVFSGTDDDLARLHQYILKHELPRKTSSRLLGWHGEYLLDSVNLWRRDGVVDKPHLFYSGPYVWKLSVRVGWRERAAEAIRLLLRLHEPTTTYALLGWTLSTFVAPQIRVARGGADSWAGEFNGLWVWGVQGSGKTITTTQFLRLTASPFIAVAGQSSLAGLHAMLSSSNVCPVFIDDPRRLYKSSDEDALREILLGTFVGARVHKGRPDLQGTVVQPLIAPCIGTGERAVEDGAVFERFLHVPFDRDYLIRNIDVTRRVLNTLLNMPLEELAGGFFMWWWDIDVHKAWERALALTQRISDMGAAERPRKAIAQIILGLQAAAEIASLELDYEEIAEQLWRNAYESIGLSPRATANTGIKDLLHVVWNLISRGRLREGEDFKVHGDALYLNINRVTFEVAEATRFNAHPLTQSMVFRLLTTKGEYVTAVERIRFPGGNENSPLCSTINLSAVRQDLGLLDSPWLYRRGREDIYEAV